MADIIAKTFKQIEPAALWKEIYILGKRSEDAAGKELSDLLRRVVKFEVSGENGQFASDFAGDFGGYARRVQGKWIDPNGAKAFPDLSLLQLFMENAESAGIWEGQIRFAR